MHLGSTVYIRFFILKIHTYVCSCQLICLHTSQPYYTSCHTSFLNQAHADLWPARAWFLRTVSVRMYACVFVCPPPRLLVTSGVMWCDIDPIRLVK